MSPLSDDCLDALKQTVYPLEECDDHGVLLYQITHTFVHTHQVA